MPEEKEDNAQTTEQDSQEQPPASQNDGPVVDKTTEKKIIYSLCYLWGILFFLPLILYKGDGKATRHANEGLVLLLFSVIGNALFGLLTGFGGFVGKLFGIMAGVYSLLLLVLGIIGIVYVLTDRDEPLPVLGGIRILK